MSLNIKLLLDKRRAKKDGSYPLIMRILYDRKSTNIPLGYSLFDSEWDARHEKIKASAKLGENITRLNNLIHKERTKAYDTITKLQDESKMADMSLVQLKKLLVGKKETEGSKYVFLFIDKLIHELRDAKKYGNANVYQTLTNALQRHTGKDFTFDQVTYSFLKKFETRHFANGGDTGGLSVYLRTLRAVFNRAIKAGVVSQESYPFTDYKIKTGKPVRKAQSETEFATFQVVDLKQRSALYDARQLYMASFYMRGMNWMDMAYLKRSNIQGDFERITYIRRKTGQPFSIKIQPALKEIILQYWKENQAKDDYLFPILSKAMPEEKHAAIIRNKRKRLNKRLKQIAAIADIEPFTIYTARHTYATMGKRKGVPTQVIQEGMGHTTEGMTQAYLDSFENQVVDDYDDLIMNS